MIDRVAGTGANAYTQAAGRQEAAEAKAALASTQPPAQTQADTVEISDAARTMAETAGNGGPYDSREARSAEGERYDAILKDLRGQYGEEEAMRRFNEIMRADGFEIQEKVDDQSKRTVPVPKGGTGGLSVTLMPLGFGLFNPKLSALGYTPGVALPRFDPESKLNTYSSMVGEKAGDAVSYRTATWAVFDAFDIDDYADDTAAWKSRNHETLTRDSGVDVAKYVEGMSSPFADRFAAESVSADLGKLVADILARSGITLEKGQEVSFMLDAGDDADGGRLLCQPGYGDDALYNRIQNLFDAAIAENPDILQAFRDEDGRLGRDDSGLLPEFSSGAQSLTFHQQRHFVFSGDEPSVVVTGSAYTAEAKGFTYQKKIADDFAFNVDAFFVSGKSDELVFGDHARHMTRIGEHLYQQYLQTRTTG